MKKRESLREKIDAWKETLHYGAGIAAIIFGAIAIRITQGTSKDIDKREEETRNKFFANHPNLQLERWSISMELYRPEVAAEIVYEMSRLLDVLASKSKHPPADFYFHETGKIESEWDMCLTSEEVQYHIACALGRSLVNGVTEEYNYDLVTAQRFCTWLFAAVMAKPDLLPDYTGIIVPNHPLSSAIRFTPKKKWRADRMHGWK